MNEYTFKILAGSESGIITITANDIDEARLLAAEECSDTLGEWPHEIKTMCVVRWV